MDIKDILSLMNNQNNKESNLANLLPLLMNMQQNKPKSQKQIEEDINCTLKKLFD